MEIRKICDNGSCGLRMKGNKTIADMVSLQASRKNGGM
jgi:hypothetical protein